MSWSSVATSGWSVATDAPGLCDAGRCVASGRCVSPRAGATADARGAHEYRADNHPDQHEGDDPGHPHSDRDSGRQSALGHLRVLSCRVRSYVRIGRWYEPVVRWL